MSNYQLQLNMAERDLLISLPFPPGNPSQCQSLWTITSPPAWKSVRSISWMSSSAQSSLLFFSSCYIQILCRNNLHSISNFSFPPHTHNSCLGFIISCLNFGNIPSSGLSITLTMSPLNLPHSSATPFSVISSVSCLFSLSRLFTAYPYPICDLSFRIIRSTSTAFHNSL